MGPATLYSTIQRLVALALIDEISDDSTGTTGDTRRRYYELTNTGRLLLETDVSRMSALARMAKARLVQKRSRA
jgi:DNA-binding PadR family transcriptional regulator